MLLDTLDRKLLNLMQSDFPLLQEPFTVLGHKLDLDGDEVLKRVRRLKDERVIRSISASFDVAKLGYHSTLVAMHLKEDLLDQAADLINRQAGVSHNYLRDNYLNLWFTLSATNNTDLDAIAAKLGQDAGADITLSLPSQQVFKILVYFDMLDDGDATLESESSNTPNNEAGAISDADKNLIRELQQSLPLEKRPFAKIAAGLDLEVRQLLEQATALKTRGVMRHYGARLDHRRAGFISNAMSCWLVRPAEITRVGRTIARHRRVSHCYERKTAPQWPYSIYGMIHGHTEEECRSLASHLSQETGIKDYVLLYSTKEYLKRTPRYFTE